MKKTPVDPKIGGHYMAQLAVQFVRITAFNQLAIYLRYGVNIWSRERSEAANGPGFCECPAWQLWQIRHTAESVRRV
jgi:hypothetical protein